jgi:hypothetical protein
MTYKTSLDDTAKVITVFVTVLFAVIIGGQFVIVKAENHAVPIYTTVGCLLIYLIAYIFHPVSYIVTKDELVIHRPVSNVHFKRSDIKTVELLQKQKIRGSIRIMGIGGLFGYYGIFANFSIGRMVWYATRRDNPVLIRTINNKKIVLTPDEPGELVRALSAT